MICSSGSPVLNAGLTSSKAETSAHAKPTVSVWVTSPSPVASVSASVVSDSAAVVSGAAVVAGAAVVSAPAVVSGAAAVVSSAAPPPSSSSSPQATITVASAVAATTSRVFFHPRTIDVLPHRGATTRQRPAAARVYSSSSTRKERHGPSTETRVTTGLQTLVEGLAFPECPRWHDGELWLSEKRAGRVVAVSETGDVRTVVDVPGGPGGLGWTSDGELLVLDMSARHLLRLEREQLTLLADLSAVTVGRCNDMTVDRHGRAYVGHFGYDLLGGAPPAPATLVLVQPDGAVSTVADDLHFPNGCALTPDETTLLVAESAANRITEFDVRADGSLAARRVFADLGAAIPDGIALDAAGALWVSDPVGCCRAARRARRRGDVARVDGAGRSVRLCTGRRRRANPVHLPLHGAGVPARRRRAADRLGRHDARRRARGRLLGPSPTRQVGETPKRSGGGELGRRGEQLACEPSPGVS